MTVAVRQLDLQVQSVRRKSELEIEIWEPLAYGSYFKSQDWCDCCPRRRRILHGEEKVAKDGVLGRAQSVSGRKRSTV